MTARAIRVALLFAVVSSAGCGTAGNLVGAGPGKKVPFGGVKRDLQCLTEVRDGDVALRTGQEWEPSRHEHHLMMVLCAADLPFSLLGDVISWPYTRVYSCINEPTDYPPIQIATPTTSSSLPTAAPPPAGGSRQPGP